MRLSEEFSRLARMRFRVGVVLMHPEDYADLVNHTHSRAIIDFVLPADEVLRRMGNGILGDIQGYLWGAHLFTCPSMAQGEFVCLPELNSLSVAFSVPEEASDFVRAVQNGEGLDLEDVEEEPEPEPEEPTIGVDGQSLWDHLEES